MNRKGQSSIMPVLLVLGLVMALLMVIFVFTIGGTIVKDSMDEILPVFNELGNDEAEYNISKGTQQVSGPINSILGSYSMFAVIIFMIGIVGVLALAFTFRGEVSTWNMALFFALVMGVVVVSIFVSNAYEELYNSNDSLGLGLQEAGLISFFILRSPTILTIVSFIAGIILFSGSPQENLV